MKKALSIVLIQLLALAVAKAQAPSAAPAATNSVQVSQPEAPSEPVQTAAVREFKIPAGTPLEIEAAYTVSSLDVRSEDLISFRVVVPIKMDGVTVIERYSLVTGRVVRAKRGGHWGKAGKLCWIMQDVVATDLTRVPIQAQRDDPMAKREVKGTSHGGEVAAQMLVFGPLLGVAAPLVLLSGFKRGENAVLPEGKRFIVFVKSDTIVRVSAEPQKTGATP
jgi:hypothetical protein